MNSNNIHWTRNTLDQSPLYNLQPFLKLIVVALAVVFTIYLRIQNRCFWEQRTQGNLKILNQEHEADDLLKFSKCPGYLEYRKIYTKSLIYLHYFFFFLVKYSYICIVISFLYNLIPTLKGISINMLAGLRWNVYTPFGVVTDLWGEDFLHWMIIWLLK